MRTGGSSIYDPPPPIYDAPPPAAYDRAAAPVYDPPGSAAPVYDPPAAYNPAAPVYDPPAVGSYPPPPPPPAAGGPAPAWPAPAGPAWPAPGPGSAPGTPADWPPQPYLPVPAPRPGRRLGLLPVIGLRIVAGLLVSLLLAGGGGILGWDKLHRSGPSYPSAWDGRVTDLVAYVEHERGLTYKHPVAVDFLPESEFKAAATTDEKDVTPKQRKEMEAFAGSMRALGLIEGDVDLFKALNQFQSEAALAFYSPVTKRVTVRGTDLTVSVRATLVHELTHVLQDQYFDLTREGKFPVEGQNDTYRAIFEGDAQRMRDAWVATLSDSDKAAFQAASDHEADGMDLGGVPDAVVQFMTAPYNFGQPFVEILAAAKGKAAVDDALREPPAADAQLMDPFRYLDGESPAIVDKPRLDAGDKETDTDVFGALALYLVLAERIDVKQALAAADAWGGDSYVDFERAAAGAGQAARQCVKAAFTGKDTASTTVLGNALDAWVAKFPAGAASVARAGGDVVLTSCDPGAAAHAGGTADLGAAVAIPVGRAYFALEAMKAGLPSAAGRCVSRGVTAALTSAEFHSLMTADELDPALGRKLAAVGAACR